MNLDTSNIDAMRGQLAPLFFAPQGRPLRAYLGMTADGTVFAGFDEEPSGSVPMDVWHGRTLRWSVPPAIRGDALADFVQRDDVSALLLRIRDGISVDWDGHHMIGRMTDDARDASERLQQIIDSDLRDDSLLAATMDVREWLGDLSTLDCWPPGDSLITAADRIVQDARREGVELAGDVEQELLRRALDDFHDHPEVLTLSHVGALHRARLITQEQLNQWTHAQP